MSRMLQVSTRPTGAERGADVHQIESARTTRSSSVPRAETRRY
jgi:hypothetical protein